MHTIATEPLQMSYNVYSITVLTPHLKFMVYRQNDGTVHFPAMTQPSQLSSVFAFQCHLSVFHLPLKIPPFWKINFNLSNFGTVQFKKGCSVSTGMVKCASADRKLHAATMTRRNKLALKFYLRRPLWSSSMWMKRALKTISSHTRLEYRRH